MQLSLMNKLLILACAFCLPAAVAQPRDSNAPLSPRAAAPFDLEGYWVSVINEDWMYRMVTPPAGQYLGVPLNRTARELADAWDPAADEQMGEQCKAYGAPAIMRIPGRVRFSWQNDATLAMETEAGEQTRTFYFGDTPEGAIPSTQGISSARWELARGSPEPEGNLRVETENLLPGYLRKNGVPYSADARVREFYSVYPAHNGDTWLVVTTEVEDPRYLTQTFITSSHFKKLDEDEGGGYWNPAPCSAD